MTDTPGLKRRKRADGSIVYYWVASAIARDTLGYPIKTVRLHGDEAAIAARCRILTTELGKWLADQGKEQPTYSGTIASLIDGYQRDEYSPYRTVKANTRHHYDQTLAIVLAMVGERKIENLTRKDFARWHRNFRFPEGEDGADRMRRAHNCMKLLRIVLRYGASMWYAGCRDAATILSEDMKFPLPPPRRSQLSFDQAAAIVDQALEVGRPSVALAQALQFELSLRQVDVIGQWERANPGEIGIVYYGQRWSNGVLWSDISPDGILTKQTTKTATVGEWNLGLYPLVAKALAAFPATSRVGPMIVSETTNTPYRPDDYRVKWRKIATAAGVPRDIWNMDSRAGGITEGDEAGAELRDLARHATHTDPKTTDRYVRRTREATERVAVLRVGARRKKESE